ncbi:MAG: response regulator [Nitrospirota bacterium]
MTEQRTVLVVDDNEAVIELLKEFLHIEGFIVHGVNNGRQALDFLQKQHCDVVISDYVMPELNGAELVAILRERYPHLFIIGISAYCEAGELLRAGAQAFLSKPFRLHDLLSLFQNGEYRRHVERLNKFNE